MDGILSDPKLKKRPVRFTTTPFNFRSGESKGRNPCFSIYKMDRFPMRSSLCTGYRSESCMEKLIFGSPDIRSQSL